MVIQSGSLISDMKIGWTNIRVDRSTILGNPFDMGRDESLRTPVIKAFRSYLWECFRNRDSDKPIDLNPIAEKFGVKISNRRVKSTPIQVEEEIQRIIEKIQAGDSIKLLCWCKPKDCHADVLVRYINWRIESNIIEEKRYPKKVISGGQTGADFAGLMAAKNCGIPTGGTAPKGYRICNPDGSDGENPDLKQFGLIEHESLEYKPRAIKNVQDSDETIWFGCIHVEPSRAKQTDIRSPAEHVANIRDVFAISMSDLASVLGVTRPTVYAWLAGQEPKGEAVICIQQLSRAADKFNQANIIRLDKLVHRPILNGRSLLDILRTDEDPVEALATIKAIADKEAQTRREPKGEGVGKQLRSLDDVLGTLTDGLNLILFEVE